jgi:dihydrofolate reductase
MRKLIVTEYLTVDGRTEGFEQWFFPFWDDEIGVVKHDELFASDGLLFGRVSYQGFADEWSPKKANVDAFTDRMHEIPKYVVSSTLEEATWNNSTIISANVAEEVARLKAQPGADILVAGSATLVRTLREHHLVDEYRLMVFPILWGRGQCFFDDGEQHSLRLLETRAFNSGVTLTRYEPDPGKAV